MKDKHVVLLLILLVLMILTGCGSPEIPRHVVDTVEVNIPVLERAEAPKELFRSKISAGQIPRWVAPTDPGATACLTPEDQATLKAIMLNRESLLDGWESYGR